MSEKHKDRKEKREVTETITSLLLPLLFYVDYDTNNIIKRALYLLGEIEVEPQESEDKSEQYSICEKCDYDYDPHSGECYDCVKTGK